MRVANRSRSLARAEARFLRALSYWHGIDLFGPIPLVTEEDPIGKIPPEQATRAEVEEKTGRKIADTATGR